MSAPNLTDTSHCGGPGRRCEACGTETTDMTVKVAHTAAGTFCWTACPPCAASGTAPPVTVSTAARLAAQHLGHLTDGDGGAVS